MTWKYVATVAYASAEAMDKFSKTVAETASVLRTIGAYCVIRSMNSMEQPRARTAH